MPARRYVFALKKVLDLRVWEEKQAENLLSAKTGQCVNTQSAIEALMVRRREAFLSRGGQELNLALLSSLEMFRLRLGKEIDTKQEELARLTIEREDLLKLYLEARMRREILSKLDQKQQQEFKKAAAKREVLVLDDLNTSAFIRRMTPMEESIG